SLSLSQEMENSGNIDDELENLFQEQTGKGVTTKGNKKCDRLEEAPDDITHDNLLAEGKNCKAFGAVYARALKAAGDDGLKVAFGDVTQTRSKLKPILITVERSLRGNRCKAMQALTFELLNLCQRQRHDTLTLLATSGGATQVEFTIMRERIEFD